MSYADVTDEDFYKFVNKKYTNKYKIPNTKPTLKKFCFPKSYELQIPQKFLAEFINPKTPYKGLLVYHKIGGGKTCVAVRICEGFKGVKKILVVVPAALKNNFRAELRTPCAGENYLTDKERKKLATLRPTDPEFKAIITESNKRIDKFYTIKSYNKFIDGLLDKSINLANTLVVIDEIHNLISETGTFYETLYKAVVKAPGSMRLVIMTATPIFDKPVEIALTMNLLIRDEKMPIGKEFYETFTKEVRKGGRVAYENQNMDLFKEYVKGYVSYFAGAPAIAFPRSEMHISKVEMSKYQVDLYKRVFKKEVGLNKKVKLDTEISNSFFIGTRLISNFVFPNGKLNEEGFESMTKRDFDVDRLEKYSPKFLKVLSRIRRCSGTVFVYSNFREYGGLATFAAMLEHYGYKNYEKRGRGGRKTFAIWSGETSDIRKEEIKNTFNNKKNEFGADIKIILGSPSISVGVSLFRVQQTHILDPSWNFSKLAQIFGRTIRFCSHRDVSPERQLVKIYIYLSTHPSLDVSIDQYILNLALQKQKVNVGFERALKEAAVDCTLFENANNQSLDDKIICDK